MGAWYVAKPLIDKQAMIHTNGWHTINNPRVAEEFPVNPRFVGTYVATNDNGLNQVLLFKPDGQLDAAQINSDYFSSFRQWGWDGNQLLIQEFGDEGEHDPPQRNTLLTKKDWLISNHPIAGCFRLKKLTNEILIPNSPNAGKIFKLAQTALDESR